MKRNWAGWAPRGGELPQQQYLISPRHLAGSGDTRHITEHLLASGWRERLAPGGAQAVYESPDHTVRVALNMLPDRPRWTISGSPKNAPAWHASISAHTPAEIIAGFTDALTQPRPTAAPNVWAPLTAAGWSTASGRHHTATAPEGTASLQFRKESDTTASWWATARDEQDGTSERTWDAVFSAHTPLHLIAGFAGALAAPQPLLRPHGAIPDHTQAHVKVAPVMVLPSQITAHHQARLNAARATARVRRPATGAWPPWRAEAATANAGRGRSR